MDSANTSAIIKGLKPSKGRCIAAQPILGRASPRNTSSPQTPFITPRRATFTSDTYTFPWSSSAKHIYRIPSAFSTLRSPSRRWHQPVLDPYIDSPPEGWPRWMDRQIQDADFVLMICTPTYYHRVMGKEEPGTGHGVMWKATIPSTNSGHRLETSY